MRRVHVCFISIVLNTHVNLVSNQDTHDKQTRTTIHAHTCTAPAHALAGVVAGANSVYDGLAAAVVGVVGDPIEGARAGGVVGFARGVVAGVTGLFTRPLVAAAELTSLVARGIGATPAYLLNDAVASRRARPPIIRSNVNVNVHANASAPVNASVNVNVNVNVNVVTGNRRATLTSTSTSPYEHDDVCDDDFDFDDDDDDDIMYCGGFYGDRRRRRGNDDTDHSDVVGSNDESSPLITTTSSAASVIATARADLLAPLPPTTLQRVAIRQRVDFGIVSIDEFAL
jgi:hypothetical protein